MEKKLKSVQDYWNIEACGTHFIKEFRDKKDFLKQYKKYRYQVEWHILELVPFAESKGKKVLEIGCGNGVDGTMFAEAGADYTGVDLTETAVNASQEHFQLTGLNGKFQTENAEKLSFPDNSFDIVYSHGVLHHTPHPEIAIKEIYRVLKPSGKTIIMLYHKHSINYYLRVMLYMRLRILIKIISRLPFFDKDRKRHVQNDKTFVANTNKKVWDMHYYNFLDQGFSYLKADNFVHRSTDGPDCPYAFVYTKSDIKRIFKNYKNIKIKVAHFPLGNSLIGALVPKLIERILARNIGFYLFIYAEK